MPRPQPRSWIAAGSRENSSSPVSDRTECTRAPLLIRPAIYSRWPTFLRRPFRPISYPGRLFISRSLCPAPPSLFTFHCYFIRPRGFLLFFILRPLAGRRRGRADCSRRLEPAQLRITPRGAIQKRVSCETGRAKLAIVLMTTRPSLRPAPGTTFERSVPRRERGVFLERPGELASVFGSVLSCFRYASFCCVLSCFWYAVHLRAC